MFSAVRSAAPSRLETLKGTHTPAWVRHYPKKVGPKPSDEHWKKFSHDIARDFSDVCCYCEVYCKTTVDHFAPKSESPELVYEWLNLVNCCGPCNQAKGTFSFDLNISHPSVPGDRYSPENIYEYDLLTGHIMVKKSLPPAQFRLATKFLSKLKINAPHHLKTRMDRLKLLRLELTAANESTNNRAIESQAFLESLTLSSAPLNSLTAALLTAEAKWR